MLRIEIVFVKCLIQSITFLDKYGPRTGDGDDLYLIPIKIRAPLIFAYLACAKMKGSKFHAVRMREN